MAMQPVDELDKAVRNAGTALLVGQKPCRLGALVPMEDDGLAGLGVVHDHAGAA